MKVFTCNAFTGFWPVGTAAVVIAETAQKAADDLNVKLKAVGLKGDATPDSMKEFPANDQETIRVLRDVDY